MKPSFLPAAWRKTLMFGSSQQASAARSRRALGLDQLLIGDQGVRFGGLQPCQEPGLAFDGSWHESSRALARGLLVREWGSAENGSDKSGLC